MPELRSATSRATVHLAVKNNAHTNAMLDGDYKKVGVISAIAKPELRERYKVGVVVNEDRKGQLAERDFSRSTFREANSGHQ